jgi:hypothetical protein
VPLSAVDLTQLLIPRLIGTLVPFLQAALKYRCGTDVVVVISVGRFIFQHGRLMRINAGRDGTELIIRAKTMATDPVCPHIVEKFPASYCLAFDRRTSVQPFLGIPTMTQ